jgi:hypothetical protein
MDRATEARIANSLRSADQTERRHKIIAWKWLQRIHGVILQQMTKLLATTTTTTTTMMMMMMMMMMIMVAVVPLLLTTNDTN